MSQPLLHIRSKTGLLNYIDRPTHGLILSGPESIGKYYVASWLARQLDSTTFTIESPDDKSAITIEQIRDLYNVTRSGGKLTIIIKDAHQLGREAQNAFLKLLEEPPKNTKFILTTNSINSLLPTIKSRSQHIELITPPKGDLSTYTASHTGLSDSDLSSLLHTSSYLPGKALSLLADPGALADHQANVLVAKNFYSGSSYERHLICVQHTFDKAWAEKLLTILAIIIQSLMKQNASNTTMLTKLKNQASLIETTSYNLLRINGNPKIHLAKLSEQL